MKELKVGDILYAYDETKGILEFKIIKEINKIASTNYILNYKSLYGIDKDMEIQVAPTNNPYLYKFLNEEIVRETDKYEEDYEYFNYDYYTNKEIVLFKQCQSQKSILGKEILELKHNLKNMKEKYEKQKILYDELKKFIKKIGLKENINKIYF